MSVADWLKRLDLGQYAQAFADNDIDLALAATLTDAD
jgi:SAM domain (Sterile alpha motif)